MYKLYSRAVAVFAVAVSLTLSPLALANMAHHEGHASHHAAEAKSCPHGKQDGQHKGCCGQAKGDACPHAGKGHGKHHGDTHACPMHPKVTGVAGDDCPKCGMKLEQVAQADSHACPMHPKVTGVAGDDCPKCGMKLEQVAQADTHVCPMHPKVTGVAGDDCPKCGMKLEAMKGQGGHAHHGHH
ncbi:hypothetical protein KUV89_14935 [Marinobacter hydrocarbonoclasticus]|nr:hypothetical protein [Marinobacter nauticus]